jgi:hypothetical protein
MPLQVGGLNVVKRDQALQQGTRLYHMKHMIIDALKRDLLRL